MNLDVCCDIAANSLRAGPFMVTHVTVDVEGFDCQPLGLFFLHRRITSPTQGWAPMGVATQSMQDFFVTAFDRYEESTPDGVLKAIADVLRDEDAQRAMLALLTREQRISGE